MKKWIRWKGLIFFFCLAALFSLIWFVFTPVFVERMIEKYGTDIVGAKVELDDADLTLLPLGFVLKHLQITNPDEPMTNAVEVADIGFSLDGLNLLRRKVVIDEMNLDQVQINTPRKNSGAIRKKTRKISDDLKKRKDKTLSLPSLKIPDVNEILEKENLVSIELIRTLDSDIKAEELKWKRILNEIPDKEKIVTFRNKIIRWFNKNGRRYPWRETKDPFKILIAEMMLQRTKADQVESVYRRFFSKFSSPEDVAVSNMETLNEILFSLGLKWRIKKYHQKRKQNQNLTTSHCKHLGV